MSDLERRKDHHLDIVLQEAVGSAGPAIGLGRYTLEYDALPELDLDDVDLSTVLFGKRLRAPIVIGAMTGGTDRAGEVNRRLARAAARVGVGMALGSQRAMIVRPELAPTFAVRDAAPDLPLLFGNVGAVQLNYGVGADAIGAALEAVGADALNLHLNPLQEAVQPEGDTRFAALAPKIAALAEHLDVPVLLKEVGGGIGARTAAKIAALPVAGVETAGVGGTSWAKVESFRAPEGSPQAEVGRRLAGFGVPTADSIRACRAALPDRVVVGSGGVRTGMDVAVALALGADVAALAAPILEAAMRSEDAAVHALETLVYEVRVICFCAGARTPRALREVALIDGPA
ncbi:MAG: type 2 isopentenyl-diphosphate Delta-isomerase [Sandaracinaceae bacterium]|nr:type 2 isopentenyl-diphosphate Delta-isomerase [Sandaracinaceae bacterium]